MEMNSDCWSKAMVERLLIGLLGHILLEGVPD
jgi:hypothetical protein